MMSNSDGGDLSDVDDLDDLEMIMQQVQSEQQQEEEAERVRRRNYIYRVAGVNNYLTVLNNSPLFDDLLDDIAPVAPFECNGVTYEKGYYLTDGIYPQ
ncbi:ALP1-like protein isoform X1 [Tanacetum coccineum]